MLADIQPGQQISVKVTREPKTAAGRKTLIRLCEKDETVRTERNRLKRARTVEMRPRAGRLWGVRPSRRQVVQTTPGASYKIFGSVDVLRELKSIADCVDVTPA